MSESGSLFDSTVMSATRSVERPGREAPQADALIARPVRDQVEMPHAIGTLDQRLRADHPVRAIWDVIAQLDLTAFLLEVESNRRIGGRPAIDPRILLTLWVFATTQGEARAEEIARRTQTEDAYRWICGGVTVSGRTLSGFRAGCGGKFSDLLTQVLAVLVKEDLVELQRITQDGTRVRALAGAGSFKRLATIEEALRLAREHLDEVLAAADDPTKSLGARRAAERAAKDRVDRMTRASDELRALIEERKLTPEQIADKKKAPRASVTDPDAKIMKFGDGGFRPGYNVQFATAADGSGTIVGVAVTTRGTDQGEMLPMRAQVEERIGVKVTAHLVDSGYANIEDIEASARAGTAVYAPLPHNEAKPGSRRDKERSDEARAWIDRMKSEEGAQTYRLRGQVAELSNANAKTRYGLWRVVVRSVAAVTSCVLLVALTNDIEVLIRKRVAAASSETLSPEPGA